MTKQWTPDQLLTLMRGYQSACVIAAAADLDIFTLLAAKELTAREAAGKLQADLRGTTILLDALVGLELLEKHADSYHLSPDLAQMLTQAASRNVVAMIQHQANCLRRWVQLAAVVKTGKSAERTASIRGAAADEAAFIDAMHCHSAPLAEQLVNSMQPLAFRHLLDIGGATGTWTVAFLRAVPNATATLFDLPHVIPMAEKRMAAEGLTERVKLISGDFYTEDLPKGADFVWLGAICHQNSRQQNRELFHKVQAALEPGGCVVIRDILMDDSRTRPTAGALFAINMLVATEAGGTYTFEELREDLESAGLTDATILCRGEFMDSLVRAGKPR